LESIVAPRVYSVFFENLKNQTSSIQPKIFIRFFVLLFVIITIVNISNLGTMYIESFMIPELFGFLYNFIFVNLLLKNENSVTDLEIGKIITRLLTVPDTLRNIIVNFCVWVFPRILVILVVNIYFFALNWKLGMFSMVLLGIFVILMYVLLPGCIVIAKHRHSVLEQVNQYTQDKLTNTSTIYSSGNLWQEMTNYQNTTRNYVDLYKNSLLCLKYDITYMTIYLVILYIALHIFSTYLFWNKELSVVSLISIFITIIYYTPCLYTINSIIPDFIMGLGVIHSTGDFIDELYNQHQQHKTNTTEQVMSQTIETGEIVVQQLTFSYLENKPPIFDKFDLTIRDKEKVAIVGPSGNGKSTLIKLFMGYYKVPDNTIWVGGKDINTFSLNDLRKQITYVHQSTKLFDTSIIENIRYGNEATAESIIEILQQNKLDIAFKNIGSDANFLDYNVGIEGNRLSGGQRQMITLLRAMMQKNKIVILDEPTSAMDGASKTHVLRAIELLSRNSTLIIITHDPDVLQLVGRIVTIDNGKIVSDDFISQLNTDYKTSYSFI